jgi:hypothetical protein
MVPRNRTLPLDFSLFDSRTEEDSRRARGLKSACRAGAFSANQRKDPPGSPPARSAGCKVADVWSTPPQGLRRTSQVAKLIVAMVDRGVPVA